MPLTPDEQQEFERLTIDVVDQCGVTRVEHAKPWNEGDLERYARNMENERRADPEWTERLNN